MRVPGRSRCRPCQRRRASARRQPKSHLQSSQVKSSQVSPRLACSTQRRCRGSQVHRPPKLLLGVKIFGGPGWVDRVAALAGFQRGRREEQVAPPPAAQQAARRLLVPLAALRATLVPVRRQAHPAAEMAEAELSDAKSCGALSSQPMTAWKRQTVDFSTSRISHRSGHSTHLRYGGSARPEFDLLIQVFEADVVVATPGGMSKAVRSIDVE